ncbi:poly ADP-ribose glycohydrolase [Peridroma alphabaculovirus]|uniref:Poly ADP-ribose glycohydrolase n=1 Tax=Peridroma alphabaculovirus TaxID=1346829 RepID=A0A068LMS2_9ABAC|nr:poly ADP-ribose glycohydrolase [Peridroma alphabaculovirus]AIE47826.1 poly ADP-ribose glycohydrolase [Peridroma alphabaculovirus]
MSDSDDGTVLAQYVSLQEQLVETAEKLLMYEDNPSNIDHFRSYMQAFNVHLQTLRDIRLRITNFIGPDFDRDRIVQCLDSDEQSVLDMCALIKMKIELHKPPLEIFGTLPSLPTTMQSYDVMGMFNDFADQLGVLEFRNIDYVVELEHLMNVNVYDVRLRDGTHLDRVDCAAIITQALLKDNNRALNFEKIKAGETQLVREKLKCLLHYILYICERIAKERKNNMDWAETTSELLAPIVIKHHMIDAKTIRLGDDATRIDRDSVEVCKYQSYHRYEQDRLVTMRDYTILYVDGKVGAHAFDDSATHEDLWYMQCPELFVLPHFIKRPLGDHESYVVKDAMQYNVLSTMMYNTTRVYDVEAYNVRPLRNFLMYESCDYKVRENLVQSDVEHLNREIAKMMSGVSAEQICDSQLVFHAGPYNCHDNRTFQFLIELLVCAHEGSKLSYCAANYEQQKELNDTVEAVSTYSVAGLYEALANYNFNTTGPMNFYRAARAY